MTSFDIKRIIEESKKDFEKVWLETSKSIPRDTHIKIKGKGESHPVRDMIQKSREILMGLGFDEVENKTLLSDADIYKEYGPEAPVILDRVFYLAKMPRPDIGLSKDKINQIEKVIGKFDTEALQEILRSYKKGQIESDDFVEEFTKKMRIRADQTTEILEKVFLEFKKLKPHPTNQTLRSHMTATWYHTLAVLQNKNNFPLALFSVGPRYRNEQREDKSHLRVHHSASIVVMDPEMSLEAGRRIIEEIIRKFNFEDIKFETKKATSKYYAKGKEQEVFAKFKGKWFEIADIGMYSLISLANFGIKYPVFNAGFGIERLVMVLQNQEDIRKLAYPQFTLGEYSDEEIAGLVTYIREPQTDKGKIIAEAIEKTAEVHKDETAPCEFTAYEDEEILVKVIEKEKGKKLIGPAGFNRLYIEDGNIYADTKLHKNYIDISHINSIAYRISSNIEDDISGGKTHSFYKVKIARSLPDINLKIPEDLQDFLTGVHKKIVVGGPIFITVEYIKK
jgi:O-phosphoseryl-tRNA synthetase